jgi:hypothetical protein
MSIATSKTRQAGADRVHSSPGAPMATTREERQEMVAVAAYFRAERRGFVPGHELEDWWKAASEIDRMLARMATLGVTREDYERAGLRNALRLWVEQDTDTSAGPGPQCGSRSGAS